jgi:hypothetical protein
LNYFIIFKKIFLVHSPRPAIQKTQCQLFKVTLAGLEEWLKWLSACLEAQGPKFKPQYWGKKKKDISFSFE